MKRRTCYKYHLCCGGAQAPQCVQLRHGQLALGLRARIARGGRVGAQTLSLNTSSGIPADGYSLRPRTEQRNVFAPRNSCTLGSK